VTSSESIEHLKARMLKEAVDSHLDAIDGRRPESLRPASRYPLQRSRRAARLGAFSAALVIASAGVAWWQVSARAVPDHVVAATPDVAVAVISATAQAAPPAEPDPSFLSRQVHPNVLDLSVRRVIVDAGHGGDNLGTSSASGILEKDVTLDIAERVRQLVVERGFEAVMTRTADDTRSLLERAATANTLHGDIFLSIHLNALRPASARGIETYYLGPSDGPELDAIAAAENRHSGYSLSDIRSLLEKIYTDARRDESRRLAESVQRALVQNLREKAPGITDRGVKTAPFVVLIATEMPAIVAEVSCLSNKDDVRNLNTAEYRQTIAEALVSGIQTFASGSRGATEGRGSSGS
jgi:N-acetylmuramoyl-L-alanine amidase